jgi:small-conductance mechanosensitive channel
MVNWAEVIRAIFTKEAAFTVSVGILVIGLVFSYMVWRWVRSLLENAGVDEAVEGTPFERTAQGFGTSTIGMLSLISAVAVYIGTIIIALNVAQLLNPNVFWTNFTGYLPRIFIAAVALIVGMILGDKARLYVSERLRSIKVPEAEIIPEIVRYSIFYTAALLALSQIGVATAALLILLAAYAFGLVLLCGLAFKDLLAASAAGIYLLLTEPYTIGDEVLIDDRRGIVQEIDMFVTRIESDGEEYIVPNQVVFRAGVVRIRD